MVLLNSRRCEESFYSISCEQLARKLLGCLLCRQTSEGLLRGRIVETEAYLGGDDRASHSYNSRRTGKNEAMYMKPGTCYVYTIYGIHCYMNISSVGEGAAVLLRALEPVEGEEVMRGKRKAARRCRDLCSGPAKLCQAFDVTRSHDKLDLCTSKELWVEADSEFTAGDIVCGPRVGVEGAGKEWASKPLRFYVAGHDCVSRK